jgi:hypothetical protein
VILSIKRLGDVGMNGANHQLLPVRVGSRALVEERTLKHKQRGTSNRKTNFSLTSYSNTVLYLGNRYIRVTPATREGTAQVMTDGDSAVTVGN